jgi:RNA polymerase sigma factor (TIGR02999 family)
MASSHEVTQLLDQLTRGNPDAMAGLMPLLYAELHKLALHHLRRERTDHTLQPTALVHEAYLRLVGQQRVRWQNRAHFFGIAAQMMRRILVDHARAHTASKRGSGERPISLDDAVASIPGVNVDVLALDEALVRLARIDAQQSRVVELRFFGGLTIKEAAEVLGISHATVEREWTVAKAWLYDQLGRTTP